VEEEYDGYPHRSGFFPHMSTELVVSSPSPSPSPPSSPTSGYGKKVDITDISNTGLRKSPNKWTKEEDQKLAMLVSIYGEKKWKKISAEMGGVKTGAQCAQHWKRVSSPDIRKGAWDEHEEDLLFRLVSQYGSSWKRIAKKIARRTDIQCRYQYLKAKQSREVKWTPREDEALLRKAMEMDDQISWVDIAEHMAKLKHTATLRTALECKERYEEATERNGRGSFLNTANEMIRHFCKRRRSDRDFRDFPPPEPKLAITRDLHTSFTTHEIDDECVSTHRPNLEINFGNLESLAAVASVLPREILH